MNAEPVHDEFHLIRTVVHILVSNTSTNRCT